ncbi:hypothetical protein D910_09642 [Dendroctonus ponderosae]|uniref:MENTAL domain-containing protein n=1 Tax=Dendroctonus ponderosae TaxID=77166 RepID=U4UQL5_DENPD|nr:hypothetical protein D910_09642 [Dendroctonus ponderosae]
MAAHSYSVNTIPSIHDYIISEDLLAGQRLDGRMSAVRRFFCLFVTFDFLFISLMWLICVMVSYVSNVHTKSHIYQHSHLLQLNGQNIVNAFIEQILHYNIHESLFDIVLVAFMRFLLLILFYAILYINHWIVISWTKTSQPVFEVLLVLASFIVSWGEAWFLDFRVIPQEVHANSCYRIGKSTFDSTLYTGSSVNVCGKYYLLFTQKFTSRFFIARGRARKCEEPFRGTQNIAQQLTLSQAPNKYQLHSYQIFAQYSANKATLLKDIYLNKNKTAMLYINIIILMINS